MVWYGMVQREEGYVVFKVGVNGWSWLGGPVIDAEVDIHNEGVGFIVVMVRVMVMGYEYIGVEEIIN
ncbi:predicted protein [Sclerotinia sclerotiorum 1980 UF-70]|uniref:Uncharacterized protein n=1 Tax=Sclerotinia sclerotiorum (strain ATCC 18683 / 1980 / Ss-1) TaxID=665079 RepID=A7F845_SCLS1|nr:predicted protein [Sclerotinia sclerotiorum 1980 UF-70]EDN98916.1 predicted protein [Sclerotinia sclerotiorum 1980 UF-70]